MSEWWSLSMDTKTVLFVIGCLLALGVIFKVRSRFSNRPFDY